MCPRVLPTSPVMKLSRETSRDRTGVIIIINIILGYRLLKKLTEEIGQIFGKCSSEIMRTEITRVHFIFLPISWCWWRSLVQVVGILTKIALLWMSCFLNGDDEQDLNNDDDDGDYQDHYDDHDDQECILLACCPRSFRVNLINASYECTESTQPDHTIALITRIICL